MFSVVVWAIYFGRHIGVIPVHHHRSPDVTKKLPTPKENPTQIVFPRGPVQFVPGRAATRPTNAAGLNQIS